MSSLLIKSQYIAATRDDIQESTNTIVQAIATLGPSIGQEIAKSIASELKKQRGGRGHRNNGNNKGIDGDTESSGNDANPTSLRSKKRLVKKTTDPKRRSGERNELAVSFLLL